jgi:hypothetical protein
MLKDSLSENVLYLSFKILNISIEIFPARYKNYGNQKKI